MSKKSDNKKSIKKCAETEEDDDLISYQSKSNVSSTRTRTKSTKTSVLGKPGTISTPIKANQTGNDKETLSEDNPNGLTLIGSVGEKSGAENHVTSVSEKSEIEHLKHQLEINQEMMKKASQENSELKTELSEMKLLLTNLTAIVSDLRAQVVDKAPSTLPAAANDQAMKMSGVQGGGSPKSGVGSPKSFASVVAEQHLAKSASSTVKMVHKKSTAMSGVKGGGSPKSGVADGSSIPPKPAKVEPKIVMITCSRWNGSKLEYQVQTENDDGKSWLPAKDIPLTMVNDYHAANPLAANPSSDRNREWSVIRRKNKRVAARLNSGKPSISTDDAEFIAKQLTSAMKPASDFKKFYATIANKKTLTKFSYKQRVKIIEGILRVYGLKEAVIRFSFIGSSVIEFYVFSSRSEEFKARMHNNQWKFIDFDHYADLGFSSGKDKMEALVSRIAFLMLSTHLVNLRQCILEGLEEETVTAVYSRMAEIQEARAERRNTLKGKPGADPETGVNEKL